MRKKFQKSIFCYVNFYEHALRKDVHLIGKINNLIEKRGIKERMSNNKSKIGIVGCGDGTDEFYWWTVD